jgi:hypothetical protein
MRKFSPYGESQKLRRKWRKAEHQFSSLVDPKESWDLVKRFFWKKEP